MSSKTHVTRLTIYKTKMDILIKMEEKPERNWVTLDLNHNTKKYNQNHLDKKIYILIQNTKYLSSQFSALTKRKKKINLF